MEYQAERKAKKAAYSRLVKIARLQGKRPPLPNPYPSAVKEIQAEEKKFVHDRFYDPNTRRLLQMLAEDKAAQDRVRRNGW